MALKYANNAVGELAIGISGVDTVVRLETGQTALFPVLGADDYMIAVIQEGGTWEIVKATAISGDLVTVVRAQEDTDAQNFGPGATFELRVTAGVLEYYQAAVNGAAPIGGIIFYSGPEDGWGPAWALCNGDNGTPDLRDRFVISSGNRYSAGPGGIATNATWRVEAGGNHDHSGNTGGTTLTVNQIPAHSHSGTTASAGSHSHTATGGVTGPAGTGVSGGTGASLVSPVISTAPDHTHVFTTNSVGADQSHNHTVAASGAHQHNVQMPPYYALAMIMRII